MLLNLKNKKQQQQIKKMSTIHTRDLLCEIRFDRMMRSVGKKMGKIDVESERERKKQPDLVRFFFVCLCLLSCSIRFVNNNNNNDDDDDYGWIMRWMDFCCCCCCKYSSLLNNNKNMLILLIIILIFFRMRLPLLLFNGLWKRKIKRCA